MRWILCIALALGGLGCMTTSTTPDGTVITSEIDMETLLLLLDRLERYQAQRERAEAVDDAAAAEAWQRRIEQVAAAIAALREGAERE